MDNAIGLPNTYKLYSSLYGKLSGAAALEKRPGELAARHPTFEQPGPNGDQDVCLSSGRQMNPYMVCKHFDSNCKLQKPLYELWMTLDWTQKDIEPKSQKKEKIKSAE